MLGARADVAFHWLGQPARFTAVDLRKRPRAELGTHCPLGPWQIQTLRVGQKV